MAQFLNLIGNLATMSDIEIRMCSYLGEASFIVAKLNGCIICFTVLLHLFIHSTNIYIVPLICQAQ